MLVSLFRKISNIGVSSKNPLVVNKRIKILNKTALLGLLMQNTHVAFNLFIENYFLAFLNLSASSALYLVWLFNYLGKYKLPTYIMLIILPLGLLPFNIILGSVGSENFLFSLIVLAFYVFDKNRERLFSIIYISFIFFAIKIILNEGIGYYMFPELESTFFYINIFYSMFSIALISDVYTRENQEHVDELNVLNESLTNQNTFINNLLKELNHRVKNNLQMVSSLFNLQANKTENAELKHELRDARDRIITIAMVHRKLYTTNSALNVELKGYISDLGTYLLQSSGINAKSIIHYQIDEIELAIEDAVHVGLIINELLTNSIKYGLSEGKGIIGIELKKLSNDSISLNISDNGKGFPQGMKIDETVSFGYFLIDAIIEQHDGSLKFYNDKGANIDIILEMEILNGKRNSLVEGNI